ncbi:MAG: LytTR family DNA-binding domain-containing protein [Cyclobacteriaceae bacterium]
MTFDRINVAYFQSKKGVVHLFATEGKKYITDTTIDELIQQTDPKKSYRANRQYIVSFDSIRTTHRYHKGKLLVELILSTEEQIVISMKKAGSFKKWIGY